MENLFNSSRIRDAEEWLARKTTHELVRDLSQHELSTAMAISKNSPLRTLGPLLTSMNQLGQYLIVDHVCTMYFHQRRGVNPELGYYLIISGQLLRLHLSGWISGSMKGKQRRQNLEGPVYTPYPTLDDSLALLLALACDHEDVVAVFHCIFSENIRRYSEEGIRRCDFSPTIKFSYRLGELYCQAIGDDVIPWSGSDHSLYDEFIENITPETSWLTWLAAMCQHHEEQCDPYVAEMPEFSKYPYQILPVAPLAGMVVRNRLVTSGQLPPDISNLLPFSLQHKGLLDEDKLYQHVASVIESTFANFNRPFCNMKS